MQEDHQFLRSTVPLAFVLFCIWIGFEFHLFMKWGMSGGEATFVGRPPGVDGFLPIASIMGTWQNEISPDEYLRHFENINAPMYDH